MFRHPRFHFIKKIIIKNAYYLSCGNKKNRRQKTVEICYYVKKKKALFPLIVWLERGDVVEYDKTRQVTLSGREGLNVKLHSFTGRKKRKRDHHQPETQLPLTLKKRRVTEATWYKIQKLRKHREYREDI